MADATSQGAADVTAAESTATVPAPAVETKPVEPGKKADSPAEPKAGKADEAGKTIAELQVKIEAYEKAEAKRNEEKLKADGKYQELIAAKEKQIEEMQKKIVDKTRVDNMRAYLKENGVGQGIIDSKFPVDIIAGDYFDDAHNVKKGAFKSITTDYPFVATVKEPNAQFQQTASLSNPMDMASYVEKQIEEINQNKELKGIITGTPLFMN